MMASFFFCGGVVALLYSLLVVVSPLLTDAVRLSNTTDADEGDEGVPVHILVTRHGLSCANMVDNFHPNNWALQKMHALMHDPLLSNAGAQETTRIGEEVKKWLDHRKLKVDLLISSVMARAMQTAALQYPGLPVFVMPYIRESGFGADNAAGELHDQIAAIEAVKQPKKIEVNSDYIAYDKGDWAKFKKMLESIVLPSIMSKRLEGGQKEAIVLAVVTHSNFMKEGEVHDKCGSIYPADPKNTKKQKSQNNQVVHIPYVLKKHEVHEGVLQFAERALGHEKGSFASFEYKLEGVKLDGGKACELVTEGLSLYKDGALKSICKDDIGAACKIPPAGMPLTQEECMNGKI